MNTLSSRTRAAGRLIGRGLLVGAAAVGILLSSIPEGALAG